MSFLDKLLGREKPAAGDVAEDAELGGDGDEETAKAEDSRADRIEDGARDTRTETIERGGDPLIG
ncbi:MAG: hypothetical protein H0V79_10700 [Actinobacteria bacterium]|nr:hypothetical protein [Actinomycetota bacterium]